ncbi:MAG TPA: ABC transporter ATP-binding protein [Candidatus Eisenbacteria bacterium]|nr:ABC transporter ATP-binding protein [Candidatus Eisenbacteria bacterium]
MSGAVVQVRGLRKRFGATLAVADLSLSLGPGEIFGFLGPNGAGKTTAIKMLLGLVRPSAGGGRLLGAPLGDRATRARVGFLPEHFRFQEWLTGRELLRFHGRLLGLGAGALSGRIAALLARVDLTHAADRRLATYSKGMVQRIGLAAALLNEPALVILDEPTSGLDPIGRLLVRDILRELKQRGVTVFLNSHLLGEVEQTCDRVAFLNHGRIVLEHALGADRSGVEVEVRADGIDGEALAALGRIGGVTRTADGLVVRLPDAERVPEVARCLVTRGARLRHLALVHTSLEALFMQVMGDEARPG